MEIKIDYFIKRKSDGKTLDVKHLSLYEEDILELASKKAKDFWFIPEDENYNPEIDKIII